MKLGFKLEGVRKIYSVGRSLVPALRGLDLEIATGEFLAIMGPSGSGKSTLLALLGGLDRPSAGRICWGDQDLTGFSEDHLARWRSERVGFLFQTFNLISPLSAAENVELPLLLRGVPRRIRRERARQLLRRVGLAERAEHKPTELSGGEQQRVALARALANDPPIILADEPTGNLDSQVGAQVLALLQELHGEGRTVVLVTHDPAAAGYGERAVRLKDGRVEAGN
ncbi:MAG TPA: ABC transporter ATP-binding protein [Candidatus Fraserbacteria bacterium]|nr:ABC transporter ATP-binding protein [Candidatus Fraserbacteria bacterium]